MIKGMGTRAMRVSMGCMVSMKVMDSTSSTRIRKMEVSCSDRKFLVVSMSEVHRWMISPVRLAMCQEKGSRSMWENSWSRMVFTMVSAALVLLTRKEYRHEDDGKGHDPEMFTQVGKTADPVHGIHNEAGEIRFLAADGAVHRCADDLGLNHIRQGGDAGRQDAQQEEPLRAPQKLPHQGQMVLIWLMFVHVYLRFYICRSFEP